jgi:UDP-N-acetylmuramoyl-L-alanyl-D-glutamate--2,6-diaminopimelate ligase
MEAYGAAKLKLLQIPDLKHRVVNIGDEFGREFAATQSGRVPMTAVWVGNRQLGWLADRALRAAEITPARQGLSMRVDGSFGELNVGTSLLGSFNAENSLIVLACLLAVGVPLNEAARALASCRAAPGRMEVVPAPGEKPTVVIDYAHTPDALSKALRAAREHCDGALWCVFGCGGDRDPGKRPLMGGIADELADHIIVTDDNPRSENPPAITDAIVGGISLHVPRVIHERGEAIATAIREAALKDLVLIAGKGHEDYQIYGDSRRPFSDLVEAQRYLGAAA